VNNLRDLLTLAAVPGLGRTRCWQMRKYFDSAGSILAARKAELIQIRGISEKTAGAIVDFRKSGGLDEQYLAEQERALEKSRARILSIWDPDYPTNLMHIHDPPTFLFLRGTLLPEDQYAIGIVGSRKPSEYGRLVTERLAASLAAKGICVVSGMASGVDTLAHRGALKSGGRTLAVLGSGLDVVYPRSNNKLFDTIAEQGAVLSEFPFGTKPEPNNFPQRNRIISGLCLGVIITQARKDSGSLITANHALDQNREVFAVPGPINSKLSMGCHQLIQSGAKLVQSVDDVLEELAAKLNPLLADQPEDKPLPPDLTTEESALLRQISTTGRHIDAISAACGLTTAATAGVLLYLELKGVVRQLPGNQFMRI